MVRRVDGAAGLRARRRAPPRRASGDQRRQGAQGGSGPLRSAPRTRATSRASSACSTRTSSSSTSRTSTTAATSTSRTPTSASRCMPTRRRRRSRPARATWTTCGLRSRAYSRVATRSPTALARRASRGSWRPAPPGGGRGAPARYRERRRTAGGTRCRPRARPRLPLVAAGASARRGHRGPCRGRQPLAVAAARARRRALLRAPHRRPRLIGGTLDALKQGRTGAEASVPPGRWVR